MQRLTPEWIEGPYRRRRKRLTLGGLLRGIGTILRTVVQAIREQLP